MPCWVCQLSLRLQHALARTSQRGARAFARCFGAAHGSGDGGGGDAPRAACAAMTEDHREAPLMKIFSSTLPRAMNTVSPIGIPFSPYPQVAAPR